MLIPAEEREVSLPGALFTYGHLVSEKLLSFVRHVPAKLRFAREMPGTKLLTFFLRKNRKCQHELILPVVTANAEVTTSGSKSLTVLYLGANNPKYTGVLVNWERGKAM